MVNTRTHMYINTRVVFGNLPVVVFTAPFDGPGIPPLTGIFSCYRLPPRALPPKNEIPSTVKKLPSHLLPSDGITVIFMFNRLPAPVTVDTAERVPPTLDTARRVPPTLGTAPNAPSVVCCTGCRATCGGYSFIFYIFWSEGSTG